MHRIPHSLTSVRLDRSGTRPPGCDGRGGGLLGALLTAAFLLVFAGLAPQAFASEEAGEEVATHDVRVTWMTGFDYSRGDYGLDRDSTLYYVPLGATIDVDYWRFVAVLPLLHSDGVVGTTLAGPVGLESDQATGLGETYTSVSRLFAPPRESLPWLELTAQISWPTRTAEILGTGNFAFAAQVDLFQSFGAWTPFARFGRNFFVADSIDDRFYASVGANYAWNENVSTGLSYDWIGAVDSGVSDGHELLPYVSFEMANRWSVGPYALIGLSSGSPDYGIGLSLRFER